MFEVITIGRDRFRFSDSLRWQYGLVSGTIDTDDKSVVEVLREDELVKTFTQVIAVGDVCEETIIEMPKERRVTQCPRCGYKEIDK